MHAVARGRVPVVRADGLRLPFEDGSFHAVDLVAVLEFASNAAALLVEAWRVARERVVVLTLASGSWLGLRRWISGRLGHPIFSRATFRSRPRTLELARETGGRVERVRAALFLPPAIAGRLPRIEERLSRGAPPWGGLPGLALSGGATDGVQQSFGDRGRGTMGRSSH